MPTRKVLEAAGVFALGREMNVPVIDLDEGPWMDVKLGPSANWWDAVAYPTALKQFDKIVYLPCMKHHFLATFTMSLKLIVGLTHPREMPYLHADFRGGKPEEPMYLKLVEMNLPLRPDLIIVDGRKAFVTDGPTKGETVEPGMVLASADQIALDVEAVKLLQAYPRDNQIQGPVWDMPIITAGHRARAGCPKRRGLPGGGGLVQDWCDLRRAGRREEKKWTTAPWSAEPGT